MYRVGVLCIQGGFSEILELLSQFVSVIGVEVRDRKTLSTVHGLIIPGGESTAISIVLRDNDLLDPLKDFVRSGKPVWGICAGMILLCTFNDGHVPALIGGLDVVVERNGFGRQSKSSLRKIQVADELHGYELSDIMHFIRAPRVTQVLGSVKTLAFLENSPVAVRNQTILGTCFHPEISDDLSWASYFLNEFVVKLVRPTTDEQFAEQITLKRSFLARRALRIPGLTDEQLELIHNGTALLGSLSVKQAMPKYLKGGVIMDVVNPEQARVAESAGACSVMALERIPADIKADGGIARMTDPKLIKEIMEAVSIPVMAKARIGHFAEARILESIDVDCIDESEVLTPADEVYHIDKNPFKIPFVCGAKDLGEALRRIAEGAAMIRLKGNAGTGNVMHAVRHSRLLFSQIRQLVSLRDDEVYVFAKELRAPLELVQLTRKLGRLPVVTFAAGGIATPADVSLMMELGCDGVFVGSGIFKGENPAARARAMVEACTFWNYPEIVARVSENLGKPMVGILDNGETYNYVQDSTL